MQSCTGLGCTLSWIVAVLAGILRYVLCCVFSDLRVDLVKLSFCDNVGYFDQGLPLF